MWTAGMVNNIGLEQELFFIPREAYERRLDLQFTGRTVMGRMPARGQELCDHYMVGRGRCTHCTLNPACSRLLSGTFSARNYNMMNRVVTLPSMGSTWVDLTLIAVLETVIWLEPAFKPCFQFGYQPARTLQRGAHQHAGEGAGVHGGDPAGVLQARHPAQDAPPRGTHTLALLSIHLSAVLRTFSGISWVGFQ